MLTLFTLLLMYNYITGLWIYCSSRKHLLVMLLVLEYMVLCSFVLIIIMLGFLDYGLYFAMIYLIFSVCEGALGLGVLVSLVRYYGNDYFQSYSVLRC